jgi:dimeric dUTPase (all-alpha-NTP-PPase superfamily)
LLEAIFNRQRELIFKYHDIEEKGFGHPIPRGDNDFALDLDDPQCQFRLKDFAWRVTEEITEATEAFEFREQDHFEEELVDALHFLVELLIYSGFKPKDLTHYLRVQWDGDNDLLEQFFTFSPGDTLPFNVHIPAYMIIEDLGKAMNCLKNKPWKMTHMLTDRPKYLALVAQAFIDLIGLFKKFNFNAKKVTLLYLNKSEVNKFRIASKY